MTNQTIYSFSPEQAGNISMMLSDLGVTLENVRRALDTFAPDYPVRDGVEVDVEVYEQNRDTYQKDDRILVVSDLGYKFATFPNSNSDGVLISSDHPGRYYGTMDVDGGAY